MLSCHCSCYFSLEYNLFLPYIFQVSVKSFLPWRLSMTHLSNICYPLICAITILSVIVLMCMHFSYLILKCIFTFLHCKNLRRNIPSIYTYPLHLTLSLALNKDYKYVCWILPKCQNKILFILSNKCLLRANWGPGIIWESRIWKWLWYTRFLPSCCLKSNEKGRQWANKYITVLTSD